MVLCAFGFLSPHLALADFEAVSRAEAYDIITTGQTLQSGVYPQRENTYHAKVTHQSFSGNFGKKTVVTREGTSTSDRSYSMVISLILHDDKLYKCAVGGVNYRVECLLVPKE